MFFQQIENVLNIALHLVVDNYEDKLISNVTVTEVETENQYLTENMKNVLNRYTQLSVSSASYKLLQK